MTDETISNKKLKPNCDNIDPMTVLVTGGTGLVGRAIQDFIAKDPECNNDKWIFCSSKDADLRNRAETESLFEKYKPTHVIHLAAKVGGLFANMNYKVEFYRENVLINDNIMECCRIYKIKKLVSFLSTCIFPDKTSYPIDESMLHDGPPHKSNEGYAYAKRLVDTMNRAYAEEYGCNFTSIIPTNIYGKYDNFSINGGHVIPGLIHKCYLAQKHRSKFTVWGSGSPLRQFIYSMDLAELTVWTLKHYHKPEPIILSVDEQDEVTIKEVALTIAEAFGLDVDSQVDFDTSKADGQYKKTASNVKLRTFLPDFQFTTLKEGIKQTVEWFIQNIDNDQEGDVVRR